MYRLVAYGLGIVSFLSILLASAGKLGMTPISMLVSLTLLCIACFLAEWGFARVWNTPFNSESWLITALIIFLIFPPPKNINEGIVTVLAGVIASISKYLLSWNGKHIFNPAAFAVAIIGLLNLQTTTWWVGSSVLWPLTFILGVLVVRKIKRFTLVLTFVSVSLLVQFSLLITSPLPWLSSMQGVLIASPLIFLSTIMLTEPATMPPRKNQQIIFGALVAVLYVAAWKIGPVVIYPEIALLLGNIYAFVVAPKFRIRLRLKEIQKISDQVYNFVFLPDKRFTYEAGQYMEWTLPNVAFDSRGNRRSFTIASSPTEDDIQVGVKFYKPSSTYKYTMSRLKPGDVIYASQLSGDFTIDGNYDRKMAFIAGGIGATSFRSMIKYITDMDIVGDICLIYAVSKPEELAYAKDFMAAKDNGVRFVPVLTDLGRHEPGMVSAKLNSELIEKVMPDYNDRIFYVSGPDSMVEATKHALHQMNVKGSAIKTDYFSGY